MAPGSVAMAEALADMVDDAVTGVCNEVYPGATLPIVFVPAIASTGRGFPDATAVPARVRYSGHALELRAGVPWLAVTVVAPPDSAPRHRLPFTSTVKNPPLGELMSSGGESAAAHE